jgi:hypothetical protein
LSTPSKQTAVAAATSDSLLSGLSVSGAEKQGFDSDDDEPPPPALRPRKSLVPVEPQLSQDVTFGFGDFPDQEVCTVAFFGVFVYLIFLSKARGVGAAVCRSPAPRSYCVRSCPSKSPPVILG